MLYFAGRGTSRRETFDDLWSGAGSRYRVRLRLRASELVFFFCVFFSCALWRVCVSRGWTWSGFCSSESRWRKGREAEGIEAAAASGRGTRVLSRKEGGGQTDLKTRYKRWGCASRKRSTQSRPLGANRRWNSRSANRRCRRVATGSTFFRRGDCPRGRFSSRRQ